MDNDSETEPNNIYLHETAFGQWPFITLGVELINIVFCNIEIPFTPPVGKIWNWPYDDICATDIKSRVVDTGRYQLYYMLLNHNKIFKTRNLPVRRENGVWDTGDFVSLGDKKELYRTEHGWLIPFRDIKLFIVIPDHDHRCDIAQELHKFVKHFEDNPAMGYENLLPIKKLIHNLERERLFEKPMPKSAGKRA